MNEEMEVVVPDDHDRQAEVSGFVIRERLLEKMRAGIDDGLHFCDAAEYAGIPFELALARITQDGDMRDWFLESKDRPRKKSKLKTEILPPTMSLLDMKKEFVGLLWEAGLFRKAANMVMYADESTDEGGQRIIEMLRVSKDFFPKEATQRVVSLNKTIEDNSTAELEEKLAGLLEKNKQLTEKIQQGEQKRNELSGEG
jgi:hypothetical protein